MNGFYKLSSSLCMVVFVAAVSGAPRVVVETADFITGVNTNGWNISSSAWTSPAYPAPVSSVAITGTNLANGAQLNVMNHDNTFTVMVTGGAELSSFTAVYTTSKLSAPLGLQVTNVIDLGFSASWSLVPDAIGYQVNFYSNVLEGASAGNEVFVESFTRIPSKGNATMLDADAFDGLTDTKAGWYFSTCYYGISPVSNVVQIGSSSSRGWLALPVPDQIHGSGYTLEFTASRFKDSGVSMPVSVVSPIGLTNWLGAVSLTTNAACFRMELPTMSATDAIYFHSTTNKKDGRVILDSIRILEGYAPGHYSESYFGSTIVNGTQFATNGMPEVDGKISVQALAVEAKDNSDESGRVDLPLASPPMMPILRAWPIAVGNEVYEEDFSALAGITKSTSWYNGVYPVPYWMCCRDNGTIVTEIGVGASNTQTSGLFKYHDNWYGNGEALGWRGSSERNFYTGIAFVNDDRTYSMKDLKVSFRPCQWNYRNEVPMTNAVEYLVTNELVNTAAAGGWTEIAVITPPYTSTDNDNGAADWWGNLVEVQIPGLVLHRGEYLIVRFADLKTKSSGGIGISYFKLSAERQPNVSCIIFR